MESYQANNPSEQPDVVIDILDDDSDDDKCCVCCVCFMKSLTDWLAPPPYASLCACGKFRCCEASNPNQHTFVVQLRFVGLWIGCMCLIWLSMLLRTMI